MTSAPAKVALPPVLPAPLSRREIRWGQGLLLAFLLMVSLPYLWCALITPPNSVWGGLLFAADDQNVHLMWAKQAAGGAFFIRDLFTTEGLVSGQHPLFFNVFALCVGWFSRLTGLDVVWGYHIARVAFAGLFIHQMHRLTLSATNSDPRKELARIGALALAVFSTGGAFLLALIPQLAGRAIFLDHPELSSFVCVPEAFALLSALVSPLNVASFALLCFLLRALIENKGAAKAFGAALILANIHTYDALPLLLACLISFAIAALCHENFRSRWAVTGAVVVGLGLPILYQALVFKGSEEFRIKALTATSPPVLLSLISTFLPLLLLGVWAVRTRTLGNATRWLWIYAACILVLVYAPKSPSLVGAALFAPHGVDAPFYLFSFSRKMLEGLQIPLLVFAGMGLAALPKRKIVAPLVLAVCFVSPLVFFAWTLNNVAENNFSRLKFLMPRYYLTDAEAGALSALASAPDKGVAVLCSPMFGAYVPRATGLATFTGHWAETLYPSRKNTEMVRFFKGRLAPADALAFLRTNKIKYVVEEPLERLLTGPVPSESRALGLKAIYSHPSSEGDVTVYEVGP